MQFGGIKSPKTSALNGLGFGPDCQR